MQGEESPLTSSGDVDNRTNTTMISNQDPCHLADRPQIYPRKNLDVETNSN